jgi:hypothetical protein
MNAKASIWDFPYVIYLNFVRMLFEIFNKMNLLGDGGMDMSLCAAAPATHRSALSNFSTVAILVANLVGDPFWQIRWFEISWENQENEACV